MALLWLHILDLVFCGRISSDEYDVRLHSEASPDVSFTQWRQISLWQGEQIIRATCGGTLCFDWSAPGCWKLLWLLNGNVNILFYSTTQVVVQSVCWLLIFILPRRCILVFLVSSGRRRLESKWTKRRDRFHAHRSQLAIVSPTCMISSGSTSRNQKPQFVS